MVGLNPPQFFKVIINRTLEDKKLMIPKKFIEKYGEYLSSSVRLKVPDGSIWKVGLRTDTNGTVWLQNGWQPFSDHYGLEFGSFLVFRFDGNSNFNMIILNKNGMEIKYSRPNFDDSENEEDDHENPSFELQTPKSHTVKIEVEPILKASNSAKHDRVGPRGPFFERTMTNASNRIIYIPVNVMIDMNITLKRNIVLRDEKGKLWATSIRHYSQNRTSISSGWSKFYRGHNLKENDKCEFEFVLDRGKDCRAMNVKITRARR